MQLVRTFFDGAQVIFLLLWREDRGEELKTPSKQLYIEQLIYDVAHSVSIAKLELVEPDVLDVGVAESL